MTSHRDRHVLAGTAFAIVDAFTTGRPFSGNPAGVLVLDSYPDAGWMQGVANELHQAETAFLVPGDAPDRFRLRWFTPVAEVALCGHATLASAHWLWESGLVSAGADVTFSTKSGLLVAERRGDRIVLDFPEVRATEVPVTREFLTALAGAAPVWTGVTSNDDPDERNMLVVLQDEAAVRDLRPDMQAVSRLPVGGLIVTAKRQRGGVVSRYFAPKYGIPEDPVTGSAHCTVAPYWRDELGATLSAEQASLRGGELVVQTTHPGRVRLEGAARTAASGVIH